MAETCSHLGFIQPVGPSSQGCLECLIAGGSARLGPSPHLHVVRSRRLLWAICRMHATKHFDSTSHPIIRSFEPNEDWFWCYVDEAFVVP